MVDADLDLGVVQNARPARGRLPHRKPKASQILLMRSNAAADEDLSRAALMLCRATTTIAQILAEFVNGCGPSGLSCIRPQILQKAQDHGVFGVCYKRELDNLLRCVMQASASLQVSP
jgi:hypothetical protein